MHAGAFSKILYASTKGAGARSVANKPWSESVANLPFFAVNKALEKILKFFSKNPKVPKNAAVTQKDDAAQVVERRRQGHLQLFKRP
jgi:hypothetical protein